jgi:CRISPR-associated protein Cas1
MRKMLNTLYVTTPGSYLYKEGETVAIKVDNELRLRLPIHTLSSIVCLGQVTCSPFLLGHCAENDVSVSFLSSHGRFLARVLGPVSGNVLLRREQYRRADDIEQAAVIARGVLTGKILNCLQTIKRCIRDHGDKIYITKMEETVSKMKVLLEQLKQTKSLDSLRGIEGIAANSYFSIFNEMIISQKNDFKFIKRTRRPPLDEVNCLLSFVYTLLYHDARSALESVGLDPAVGYLHRDRPGRLGLALDLMEELRPVLADRLVLSLINLKQIKKKGFVKTESGAVLMDDETRKILLVNYQERKADEISHPFLNEKIPIGMVLFSQAQLLSRYLRGDMDAYPPFILR